jgi:hypothetical protein
MNAFIVAGVIIVNLALISYSAFFFMKKKPYVTAQGIFFLISGVALDACSTILMIIGSSKAAITTHGLLGYSALAGMILEASVVTFFYRNKKRTTRELIILTRVVFPWWVMVYIAGILMTMGV